MHVSVNGVRHAVAAQTLEALLGELGYGTAKVATAVNGVFVATGARAGRDLADGDQIEIVAPRQGG